MQATSDFTASLNGKQYTAKKGEEVECDARAEARLKAIGLLKKAEKGAKNER